MELSDTSRRAGRGLGAFAVLAGALLVAPGQAGASVQGVIPDGNQLVRNVNSQKCLTNSTTGNNGSVYQMDCLGGSFRTWYFRNVGGDDYQILNQASGRCLAIGASSTREGEVAITWDCAAIADQTWTARPVGDGYQFVNRNSGKCLAIGGSRTDNGAKAIQWTCGGIADQQWRFY